jgi:dihydroorotase
MKVAPPLRTESDRQALLEALADGTVDCIATDHAPHSEVEKDVEFDCAACGMLGLETALPLTLDLWRDGVVSLHRAIELLTSGPARLFRFGEGAGSLEPGGLADLCVVDPDLEWTVDRDNMKSKSRNTPFHGRKVAGSVELTLVGGRAVHVVEDRIDG